MQNDIVPPPSDVKTAPMPDAPPAGPTPAPAQPVAAPKPVEQPKPDIAPAAKAAEKADKPSEEPTQPVAPKKKSDKPVGVIVTAVVLFIALAGVAVYAGLSSKKDAPISPQQNSAAENNTQSSNSSEDLNSAVTQSDSLQGDVQDMDSDVTDQALGL